jgi:glucokinase
MRMGVDVGGTKTLALRLAEDGSVAASARRPTPTDAADLVELIAELCTGLGAGVSSLGVGIAGFVTREGTVRYSPNLPAVIELPLREQLTGRLGIPVTVENDATAAAWGEAMRGAGVGCDDLAVVSLGTGIGVGIVAEGRLLRGAHGFAGEGGHVTVDPHGPMHVTGRPGPWELYASGHALGRLARVRAGEGRFPAGRTLAGAVEAIRGEHVQAALVAGDADALDIVAEYAAEVARGLTAVVYLLDPARIVLGGGVIRLGEPLRRGVEDALAATLVGAEHRPRVRVALAVLGVEAAAIGAALLAAV